MIATLIEIIDAYARATGVSPATVSLRSAASGGLYRRLRDGHSITVHRAARIVQWLSDHWPADLAWPDGVGRPPPSPESPAAGFVEEPTEAPANGEASPRPGGGDPSGGRRGTFSLPSPSRAAAAADLHQHPMKRVKAALDRRYAAMTAEPADHEAAAAAEADAIWAGAALRRDGRLASPDALCLALGMDRQVYDYCRDHYLRLGDKAGLPRRGMAAETMLAVLGASGDVRFAGLPVAQAAMRALAARGDARFVERSAA